MNNIKKSIPIVIIVVVLMALGLSIVLKQDQTITINGQSYDHNSITLLNATNTLNQPEKFVLDFYKYYFANVYGRHLLFEIPEIKLTSEGVYQLDPAQHLQFLNESGYFSSKFYKNELPKFEACNKGLEAVEVREVEASGASPAEFVKDGSCAFLFRYQWVGGQGEELNSASVVSSEINNDEANVIVMIGRRLNDLYIANFNYSIVDLVKEGGQWRIDRITTSRL